MSKSHMPTSKFTYTLVLVLLSTLTLCPPAQANHQTRPRRVLQQKSQPSATPTDQSEFEKFSANPEFQLYLKNRKIYTKDIKTLYKNFAPQKVYLWEWKLKKSSDITECKSIFSELYCERALNSIYLRDSNFCKFLLTSGACPAAVNLFKTNIMGKIPANEALNLFPDKLIIQLYIQTFMGMYIYYTGDSGWKFTSLNKMLSFY
jgi:hypothetical protein